MKYLILTLTLIATFSHAQDTSIELVASLYGFHMGAQHYQGRVHYSDGSTTVEKVKFNNDNKVYGLRLNHGKNHYSIANFKNSVYRDATMLEYSRSVWGNFELGVALSTGYEYTNKTVISDLVLAPTAKYSWDYVWVATFAGSMQFGLKYEL